MYVGLITYKCTRCDHQQILAQRPHSRVTGDGSLLGVPAVIAWCHDQGRIVESEEVSSVERLESLLAQVEELIRGGTPLEELESCPAPEDIRRQIAWRETRTGPPRCLECGSTRITQERSEDPDGPGLEHPGCGGRLVAKGLNYESYTDPELLVDSEGHRVDPPQPG